MGEGAGGCLLVYGGADAASSPLDDLWVLRVDPRWALPRDEFEARPQLTWRALVPASSGALPPPRAFHASVLVRETLFVIGGEAAGQQGSAGAAPRSESGVGMVGGVGSGSERLWSLHVPSLRWTVMYAARGVPHPRPGSGAAAVLASLSWPPPPSPTVASTEAAGEPARVATTHESILLLGGQGADRSGLAMPFWVYPLGKGCAPKFACARGEACDGATGRCVCEASGATPPCKPPSAPPAPRLVVRDGALRMVGQAWALVGASVAGASVGAWAARRMAALSWR